MISWTVSSPLIVANSSDRVLTPRSVVVSSSVRSFLTLSWSFLSNVIAFMVLLGSGISGKPLCVGRDGGCIRPSGVGVTSAWTTSGTAGRVHPFQAPCHLGFERFSHGSVRLEHLLEAAVVDLEQEGRREGRHGGCPGPLVKQRDLSEEAPTVAGVDDHAAAADLHRAGDEDIEVALVPALMRERRAGGDFLHLAEFGDPRQHLAVHAGEQRGPLEHGDLVAHGWSFQ